MQVKLIAVTKIVDEELIKDLKGVSAEDLMMYCARVSNPNNQTSGNPKLLEFCAKNKHWSIFETANMTIEIDTTRMISPQILRHKSFSFQEFCLAGDSKISIIKSSGATATESIERLYKTQSSPLFKGKKLRVFDESTGKFTYAQLKEVFKTGKKPVYKTTLSDGKTITTTKDHKFLTKEGFESLENIVGLDANNCSMSKIGIIAVNGEELYKNKSWLEKHRNNGLTNTEIGDLVGVTSHTIKKWIKINGLSLPHGESQKRGAKTQSRLNGGPWNKDKFGYKTSLVVSDEHKQKIREARSGAKSNWWKGGVDRNWRQKVWDWTNKHRNNILNKYNYICQECGIRGGILQLHHVIPVYEDKSLAMELTNIVPVHKSCHDKIHNKDKQSWQKMGVKGRPTLIPKWEKIVKIEYVGEVDTYDIEVDHDSHNYVANKIVVHNSQRYAAVDSSGVEIYVARRQDKKNRQNSVDDISDDIKKEWERRQLENWRRSFEDYQWALDNDIAKECARAVLPLQTRTKMYMNGTIRSWIHYIDLRAANGTQKEHMDIAVACKDIFCDNYPQIAEALGWKKSDSE